MRGLKVCDLMQYKTRVTYSILAVLSERQVNLKRNLALNTSGRRQSSAVTVNESKRHCDYLLLCVKRCQSSGGRVTAFPIDAKKKVPHASV